MGEQNAESGYLTAADQKALSDLFEENRFTDLCGEVERIITQSLYVELRQAADCVAQPAHDIHPLAQVKGDRNTHATGWKEGRRWSHDHLRDRADSALGVRDLPPFVPATPEVDR